MDILDGFRIMMDYAKSNNRHKNYKETVDNAKMWTMYATGKGIEKELRRFARREDDAMFQQRVLLTQDMSKCVTARIGDIFNKVPRSFYTMKLRFEDDPDNEMRADLTAILADFWGGKSLDKYLCERLIELNMTDPNTFIVYEFGPFDNKKERVKPYPFEVPSKNVARYKYNNNRLSYLLIDEPFCIKAGNNREVKLQKLTNYLPNQTLQAVQLAPNDVGDLASIPEMTIKTKTVNGSDRNFFRAGKKVFLVVAYEPHNLGKVPAFHAGFIPDLSTNRDTRLSLFDRAMPLLKKMVKTNSELDLTMTLSAFPIRMSYKDPCTAVGCDGGEMADGSVCKSCKGTGYITSTSAQEEVVFKKPKNPDDAFDLDKMLAFKSPPVDLLRFQDEYVEALGRRAVAIVFNSDIFSRQEIADTATGKSIALQNVYDALLKFSEYISWAWGDGVDIVADLADLTQGLERSLMFSKDFKLKTYRDVLEDIKLVNDSGGGTTAKDTLQSELMRLMLDEPEFIRYEVRRRLDPFAGLSNEEKLLALSSPYTATASKVLYFNLSRILDKLESDEPNFYGLPEKDRREKVDNEVATITKSLNIAPPSIGEEI